MFINYLQMVNFRNFKSAKFIFKSGANTIVGDNDSGKSNAITALRLLLDDSYYASPKRLKDTDFSYELPDWRGHWIIISGIFGGISSDDRRTEICSSFVPDEEDEDFLSSYIRCSDANYGIITLLIRPLRSIRKQLSQASNKEEFESTRKHISINDYEYIYTCRAQTDFTDEQVYKKIVGDFETGVYVNPDNDDTSIIGVPLNIRDAQTHISVIYIDALRDVQSELHKNMNPIRRMMDSLETKIHESDKKSIQSKIGELNSAISSIGEISEIGTLINVRLRRMIGLVYSPDLKLESQLNDDMTALSKYLALKPSQRGDIESLGLGHLNMIYISLKLVEFEILKTRELLNLMLIEEPEAHIHNHIQKTLFGNLKLDQIYTQVIMTTHSVHLSEASDISSVNALKTCDGYSIVMQPTTELDIYGAEKLKLPHMSLTKAIERYLDVKRSVLVFSKAVILVEGDGEELLIPNMVQKALGVSLDELGIGLINIGSISFEYIASLFSDKRIQKNCAIVTDYDEQIVTENSRFHSNIAQERGKARKDKLSSLYNDNPWVMSFYAPHTFEVDFAEHKENRKFIASIIDQIYTQGAAIKRHKFALNDLSVMRAETVLTIADELGKGWYATVLAGEIDESVVIPDYILSAIAFASSEVITEAIKLNLIYYALSKYTQNQEASELLSIIHDLKQGTPGNTYNSLENRFVSFSPDSVVAKFIVYQKALV